MQENVLMQVLAPGSYLAVWKLVAFLLIFGFWAYLGQWFDKDAFRIIKVNRFFWNNIYLAGGILIFLLWFLLPVPFIVGLPMSLVIWAMTCILYILHRNSRVPHEETILTADHLRWLLSAQSHKQGHKKRRLVFISVNDNELPVPLKNEKEYPGYVAAEDILHDMWKRRVSHAVLVPTGQDYQLRYKIDGIMTVMGEKERESITIGIQYLKAVAGLDTEDHRKPQKGSFFTIRTGEKDTGWRISTSGSTRGEQLTLDRIEEAKRFTLNKLGLLSDQQDAIKKIIAEPSGIVLISGPKNSGISTTLYCLAERHDAFIQNIHTFENEYLRDLDNVTQHRAQKGPDAKNNAQQMRSVLLADPDVAMIGFCDSNEMAQLGTDAAYSEKKKLYYCLNEPSAMHALQSWIRMVANNKKVARTLVGVTNQRLIRILCPECRQGYTPDAHMLKKLNLPVGKIKEFYRPPDGIEYDRHGNPILCSHCQGTGYLGQTAIFEVLFISDALRKLIANEVPLNVIRTQCRKERMLFLQEQGLRKVIEGSTSIQEILRVTIENQKTKTRAAEPEK